MKKIITLALIVALSGCAGFSAEHKAETKALKNYQRAEAKVERKTIKLANATALSAASIAELNEAKKELKDAENALHEALK